MNTTMPLRSRRERALQTVWFEALGIGLVSPLLALFSGTSAAESVLVLGALSLAVMCWAALYNTLFDRFDLRCTGTVASERSHGRRVLQAIGLEATATLVTWPLLVWLTPLGWFEALATELGLTAAYAVYGYCFHIGFDRLRPVRAGAGGG
jgi:uncharacterized membrane protein